MLFSRFFCVSCVRVRCSEIGPELYEEFGYEREKIMVDHIHALGAIAKIHICGDTTKIIPLLIKTGADIIDIDHMASDMAGFASCLKPNQVLSGNADPVAIILNGTPEQIIAYVRNTHQETNGRTIISAGCEIAPNTPMENLMAFRSAAELI